MVLKDSCTTRRCVMLPGPPQAEVVGVFQSFYLASTYTVIYNFSLDNLFQRDQEYACNSGWTFLGNKRV